jgi:hypothetical protein
LADLTTHDACLHILCDRLNTMGLSAAVTCDIVDPRHDTPRISKAEILSVPGSLDNSILIYPEIVIGNPLRGRHVVRYLLNKPGYLNRKTFEEMNYGADEYYIHFADEFRPEGLKSRLCRLPLVDTTVFHASPRHRERVGFVVYSSRVAPDVASFPGWVSPVTIVSIRAPLDPHALADLYQSSRALIVAERTLAMLEALHCGCPTIIVPNLAFDYAPLLNRFGSRGFAIGFDLTQLAQASEAAETFDALYAAQSADADTRLRELVLDAASYFGLPHISARLR